MSPADGPHDAYRPTRRWWWAMVVLIVAIGSTGSVWVGKDRVANVRAEHERVFDAHAERVSASIGTELRRMGDLVANAATFVELTPGLTNTTFDAWSRRTARERHAGAHGFGYIARVDAADLDDFAATAAADPSRPTPSPFVVQPPGDRPSYCLARFVDTDARQLVTQVPPAFDLCSSDDFARILDAVGDSGDPTLVSLSEVEPPSGDGEAAARMREIVGKSYAMIMPVYRGSPLDAVQRRAFVAGWLVGIFDGPSLVADALPVATRDVELRLTWTGFGERVEIAATAPITTDAFERTDVFRADGRWTLKVRQSKTDAHASARAEGWWIFGAAEASTLLLAALFVSLLSARNRALRMVALRTDELRYQALHDAVTGLPNRVLALDRCEQALARAHREHATPAVLFLDLDNFKSINDTFGHAVGDELLQAVALRLRTTIRESETVARLGGDEFVVITDGTALGSGAELLAQRILDVMAEPFVLRDLPTSPLVISISVGVATGDRVDASQLLRDADVALYRAKEAGKGRYVVFEPEMQTIVHDRLQLELDLHRALEEDELRLVYQPTFSLDDGVIIGVEALLRWHHPARGVVAPNDFIHVAEEIGVIVPIGEWVLREACRQGAEWHAAGQAVNVAVNVSPRQLDSDDIVGAVRSALEASGLAPQSLIIEITESALMEDAGATAGRLHALKAIGVRIAVDDFGTGYSSLSYLQQFPVDTLKIDRSFISALSDSVESRAMVHTLVQLGKSLGLETLAEGIERDAQLDHLRTEDCDSGQGFLFARPLDAEAASAFFRSHPVRSAVGVA